MIVWLLLSEIISVSQAPWIWNEQLASRVEVDETADWDLDRDDQKEQRAATDRVLAKRLIYKAEEEKGKGARQVSDSKSERTKPESSRQLTDINGTREKTESATQSPHDASSQSVEERGVDPYLSRPAVRTAETEMEMETGTRIMEEKEVSTASQFSDRGTDDDGLTKEDGLTERSDTTRFEDECESTCPRRISRSKKQNT
ncbi:uncharacterized protein LOC143357156 isoform X3 [Halictus rubicundus]|uniref:uncharacterized protein LOC143357156 isoform X3 n=1 Tax=Halictus rubicundus TaxID=77578 RepID=UPI004035299E